MFLTGAVGLAVVVTANGGWSVMVDLAVLRQVWPRLLIIAVGSSTLGFVTWWISTGPMRESRPLELAGEGQP